MNRTKSWFLFLALLLVAGSAWAQGSGQKLVLEFVDGNDLTVVSNATTYTYASGGIVEGDALAVGAVLRTGPKTTAELRLVPNGTIIKLAKSTTFRVEGLATPTDQRSGFTLLAGKIRAVAAKGGSYEVYTGSTVAGVRGTDFTMSYEEGSRARLMVSKGSVEFGRRGEGNAILDSFMVNAGQFADFFGSFMAQAFSQDMFQAEFGDVVIDPLKMPVQAEESAIAPETKPEAEDKPAGDEASGSDVSVADKPVLGEDAVAQPEKPAPESPFVSWLRETLGMEIGSVTINGVTWAKAVIQPTINLGKLKMALYLPVIYSKNLFDPADWYHPNGNDEWSFGTDIGWSSDPLHAALDALSDIALKFKYIEYGQPLEDQFFIKAGNLSSFTVGHGLVMRNYANDTEFPAVRRLGLNLGLDLDSWGFEALVNDAADPSIFGGRLFMRPVKGFKLAVGASAVADIAPAAIFNTESSPSGADAYGDPVFVGFGLDLDMPIINTDILGIRMFADAASMLPIVRNDAGATMDTGARLDMIWGSSGPENWGFSAGFMGNVLFIDWRLEYRYFTGAFRPAFFDSGYERSRAELVQNWAGLLSGVIPIDQAPTLMGIYGEGSANILKDKLALTFAYFWPWSADAKTLDQQLAMSEDYFKAKLVIRKGLIPLYDISGSITYERRNFARTLLGKESSAISLFDENTVFAGELVLPVPGAPNLDLAFLVSTVIQRGADGSVIYRDDNSTRPKIVPAITLETRLHF